MGHSIQYAEIQHIAINQLDSVFVCGVKIVTQKNGCRTGHIISHCSRLASIYKNPSNQQLLHKATFTNWKSFSQLVHHIIEDKICSRR